MNIKGIQKNAVWQQYNAPNDLLDISTSRATRILNADLHRQIISIYIVDFTHIIRCVSKNVNKEKWCISILIFNAVFIKILI